MSEIVMCKGLPASGKSTWARARTKEDPNWFRLNRDDLRTMLYSSRWSHRGEDAVVELEKAMAHTLLRENRTVIIDDTNLSSKNSSMWKEVAYMAGAEFEEKFFDTPLQTCIERDAAREKPVGRNVIVKFAHRNKLVEWPDKPIVLCDIDGTLADGTHREHLVAQSPKNWKDYFELLEGDKSYPHIFKWMAELSKENTIVIVSGRDGAYAERTIAWFESLWSKTHPLFPELDVPRFPVFEWFFRDNGDKREDEKVKLEVLNLLPRRPWLVADDRPRMVRAWREANIFCIPVKGECPEF